MKKTNDKMNKDKLKRLIEKTITEDFDYFFLYYATPNEEWCGDDETLKELWNNFIESKKNLRQHIDSLCEKFEVNEEEFFV